MLNVQPNSLPLFMALLNTASTLMFINVLFSAEAQPLLPGTVNVWRAFDHTSAVAVSGGIAHAVFDDGAWSWASWWHVGVVAVRRRDARARGESNLCWHYQLGSHALCLPMPILLFYMHLLSVTAIAFISVNVLL
jgi:hypothetical protein